MASSDDEGEMVPSYVSDYEFISADNESISFATLPVEWNKGEMHERKQEQTFLSGKTDNGLRKIYKQVIVWKFDLSLDKPEISVLSLEGYWIKLLKPRKPFEDIIRTIVITVHFLHYVKWNPQRSQEALWGHLNKSFSNFERRPSEDDLRDHFWLISEAVKRDEVLANSKLLNTFLEEKPVKRKMLNEVVKPPFIVEDVDEDDNEEGLDKTDENGNDESDEDDCFDSVCAICDNGGNLYICDGKCMRSFHATVEDGEESQCESLCFTDEELEVIKDVSFYCKNCEYKQHQCFACGKLGSSDESSGPECSHIPEIRGVSVICFIIMKCDLSNKGHVIKESCLMFDVFCCVNGACGFFYHPCCVAKLLHPEDEAAAEEHQQKIAAGEKFACPAHRCHVCKELEVRSIKELQFAVCRRCPRAYHRKCLPREIALDTDVELEPGFVQRAWEDLIPNRVLIYCLNHIKFPGPQREKKEKTPLEYSKKNQLKERGFSLDDTAEKKFFSSPLKGINKVSSSSKQGELSRRRSTAGRSSKMRRAMTNLGQWKEPASDEREMSLADKLYTTFYAMDSGLVKSSKGGSVCGELETTQKVKPTARRISSSVNLDADTKKRIFKLMKDASSSLTLDQVKGKHKSPSTHTQYSKFYADNVTLGKVDGSVQSLRAALKKLEGGGSIQDAKMVCGNDLLVQMFRWKIWMHVHDKLRVYLSPFLYGMRYTSFGRHFTKLDKLKEIVSLVCKMLYQKQFNSILFDMGRLQNTVNFSLKDEQFGTNKILDNFAGMEEIVDMLHWYIQDGDMLVDFCCGSNDFSCLMKKKLDDMGKRCSFKNYDILQAKNDFNFEPRDWMSVRPDELPDGSQLIMGLNPPFGVNAALANKFINKALEFKPKLIILIVPRETEQLDVKDSRYDLVWEDDQMFAGKSFYLPGSVDVFDKHIEDWNVNAPVLCLWSNPTWTSKHKAIAEQHGHLSGGPNKCKLEENTDFDKPFVIKSDDPINTENPEQKDMVIASSKEDLPLENRGTEGDKDNTSKKNKTKIRYSNNLGGKRKRKKRSNSMSLDDKSARKRLASRHVSPRVTDRVSLETSSPKRLENPPQAHSGRHQQLDRMNFSTYHQPYAAAAGAGYGCVGTVDDVVRRYSLNGEGPPHPGMTAGRQAYSPSPSPRPDYGFRGLAGRGGANSSVPYRSSSSYVGEMIEENDSWGHKIVSNAGHGFPSSFGQVNPAAANPGYSETNTSAMQRYAARLDAPNHGQMSNMVNGPPLHEATGGIYHFRGPRPASHVSSLGFAPGPCRPYSQHNSSGWLNE
ncbi:hypothetical protein OROHE_016918 [Orobanche hederae]